mmetsp:Transcript_8854/g.21143  ORF Transcript_8854/g.21143 Transcript_8854/m.21143 type:complete len:636 (+) Transcript_8854:45-1952(+)
MDVEPGAYAAALEQHMLPFVTVGPEGPSSGEEDCTDMEEDMWDESPSGYPLPPRPPPLYRTMPLRYERPTLLGTNLAGDVIFTVLLELDDDGVAVSDIKQKVAASLGEDVCTMSFLKEGKPLLCEKLTDFDNLTLRQMVDTEPVFLCRPRTRPGRYAYSETTLGEAVVELDRDRMFAGEAMVQAVQETRVFVTGRHIDVWLVYTKLEVFMYCRPGDQRHDLLQPLGFFPQTTFWKLPRMTKRWGARCDVWSTVLDIPNIKRILDEHAFLTDDRPIPRYQMIVDPNRFVHETPDGPVWVPCEFDITEGVAQLVGGSRSHRFPHLAKEVATPVLNAALPLLARLRRPQLLLEGQRLQAVFKAQRIILPPATGDNETEYIGLWHVDGHREDVVAVVLYYYHVDSSLRGGDMEFCGREPLDVLGIGDCDNNFSSFTGKSLRTAFRGTSKTEPIVQNCRTPVTAGTLLVFSNYQMVHRVLRMVNATSAEASRDFVALFILNPRAKQLPARCKLSGPHLLSKTLQFKGLGPKDVQRILEYVGELVSVDVEKARRNAMLGEQLEPSGKFVGMQNVHSTGNGCFTMVGWLHHALREREGSNFLGSYVAEGEKCLRAMNRAPPSAHGLSAAFSQNSEQSLASDE